MLPPICPFIHSSHLPAVRHDPCSSNKNSLYFGTHHISRTFRHFAHMFLFFINFTQILKKQNKNAINTQLEMCCCNILPLRRLANGARMQGKFWQRKKQIQQPSKKKKKKKNSPTSNPCRWPSSSPSPLPILSFPNKGWYFFVQKKLNVQSY